MLFVLSRHDQQTLALDRAGHSDDDLVRLEGASHDESGREWRELGVNHRDRGSTNRETVLLGQFAQTRVRQAGAQAFAVNAPWRSLTALDAREKRPGSARQK